MMLELDGAAVHVGTGGTPWRDGEPGMVFVHGAGMDHTVWVLLARYFARRGYSVVAPDLPGHGRSAGSPLASVSAQADWLIALIDRLQADEGLHTAPPVLVGHSMGSLVALEAAARRPERFARLMLLGSAWPMPVGEALLDAAHNDVNRAADMIVDFSHAYASKLGHNPVAGIRVTDLAHRLLLRAAPGVLANDLAACNAYTAGDAACDAIAAAALPVTLIAGRDDRMTPLKAARSLANRLRTECAVLDTCGHMMMSEQPETTLAAMRNALG